MDPKRQVILNLITRNILSGWNDRLQKLNRDWCKERQ